MTKESGPQPNAETNGDRKQAAAEARVRKEAAGVAREWITKGLKQKDFYFGPNEKGRHATGLTGYRTYESKVPTTPSGRFETYSTEHLSPEDLIKYVADKAEVEANDELYGQIEGIVREELNKAEEEKKEADGERRREAKKQGIDEGRLGQEAKRIADEWRKAGLTAEQFSSWRKRGEDSVQQTHYLERRADPKDGARYRSPENISPALLIAEVRKEAGVPDELWDDELMDKTELMITDEIKKGEVKEQIEKS